MSDFEFGVGDRVRVIDIGQTYELYANFFVEHNLDVGLAAKFQYDHSIDKVIPTYRDLTFIVDYAGLHNFCSTVVYLIHVDGDERRFLIGEEGLESLEPKLYECVIDRSISFTMKANSRNEVEDWLRSHRYEDVPNYTIRYEYDDDTRVVTQCPLYPFDGAIDISHN